MLSFKFKGEADDLMKLLDFFITRQWLQAQLDGINAKLQTLENDMATKADIEKLAADSARETEQIKTFIGNLQSELQAKLDEIAALLASSADNAEFRAAVEAALPGLQANVAELDKFTPEPGTEPTPAEV